MPDGLTEAEYAVRQSLDHVLTLKEQRCILRAGNYAFHGQHLAAEEYRLVAGYGGLTDPAPWSYPDLGGQNHE